MDILVAENTQDVEETQENSDYDDEGTFIAIGHVIFILHFCSLQFELSCLYELFWSPIKPKGS